MINPTRTELKRVRNEMQRWYSKMAQLPDGSTEGYWDRWDRLGRESANMLLPPISVIGAITRVLEDTKGNP